MTEPEFKPTHRQRLARLRQLKVRILIAEGFLADDRLDLGRQLIEGVEDGIPVAEMARATGSSRETAYKLMRKCWQNQRDLADSDPAQFQDDFEAWTASLRPATRRLLERPAD